MSNQIVITSGAKLRDLDDVIIGTDGILSSVAFNVANGVPRLDENGKILVSQLPNSVMEFKGVWNAATNTPTLVNGTGNAGDVWLCNVAGTVNFGAGPIVFAVGDYAVYTGTVWARSSGATGTVTSVGVSRDGNSLVITGSPVTSSGTINLGFSGDNTQYINGAGNLTTFPTLITSIGLTMPAAFGVSNSPLTANGTIGVTALGYPSQYIRGDGTLADFPTSGGGGSSVSYYLNGGTSQGTIGGTTYYEMSKIADTGTGVDFSKSGNGLICAFLTDAGDPSLLQIPAGNWNYEIYVSMSANGGTPELYAELYKYDGTTFTLISTSSNEILYDGTNLNLYSFAMAVPETVLTVTDRLAIKLYATNSGGKTTTVHTQNGHLCQVITTFTTGLTALNGLTAQVQYFGTGTSGSDFNIVSSVDTHTFNLPTASATKRGALSSADWSTFNGKQDYITAGTTLEYWRGDKTWQTLNTSVVPELTNLYFTNARARTAISLTTTGSTGASTYDNTTGVLNIPNYIDQYVGTVTSVAMTVPTGLSISGSPITSSGTLAVTLTAGYSIPTNASQTNWDTAYTNRITSLTVTGSSGASTLISNVLNIPTYTLAGLGGVPTTRTLTINGVTYDLSADRTWTITAGISSVSGTAPISVSTVSGAATVSIATANTTTTGALTSTDWNTFNNKQNALTNPVTGVGTVNYLPKWATTGSLGDSRIFENTTGLGLGTASPYGSSVTIQYAEGARNRNVTNTRYRSDWVVGGTGTTLFNSYDDTSSVYKPLEINSSFLFLNSIAGSGNVAIGTSTDNGSKLQVSGSTQLLGSLTSLDSANTFSAKFGGNSSTPAWVALGTVGGVPSINAYNNGFSATANLALQPNGGAVLIGTSSSSWGTNLVVYGNQLTITGGGYDGTFADYLYFGGNSENTTYRNKISNSISSTTSNQRMKFSIANGATTWVDVLTLYGTGAALFSSTVQATRFSIGGDPYINVGFTYKGTLNGNTDTWGAYQGVLIHAPSANNSLAVGYQAAGVITKGGFTGLSYRGFQVDGVSQSGTGTIDTTYGIYIASQSIGTNNYSAYFAQTVLIGTTTQLTGGGTLQVNGNVNINGLFQINGVTIGGGGGSGVTGSGTANYITKWTGSSTLSNSALYESGGNIAIGSTVMIAKFNIYGAGGGSGSNNNLMLTTGNNSDYFGNNQIIFAYNASEGLYAHAIKSRHNSAGYAGNALDFYTWKYGDATTTIAGQYVMTLLGNGAVGIGETNPALSIGGGFAGLVVKNNSYLQLKLASSVTGNSAGMEFIPFTGNAYEIQANSNSQWFVYDRTNSQYRLNIFSNGNVVIGGNSDNGYKLQVSGSASFAYGYISIFRGSSGAGDIFVGNTGSTFYIGGNTQVAGSVSASGGFFDTSDARLKTLVEDNYLINSIANVKAKLYIKDGRKELGYYAQDLEGILPTAVKKGVDGYLSLSYNQVHTAKIGVIEDEVTILKNKVSELETKLQKYDA